MSNAEFGNKPGTRSTKPDDDRISQVPGQGGVAGVMAARRSAVSQIHRSLKAWRAEEEGDAQAGEPAANASESAEANAKTGATDPDTEQEVQPKKISAKQLGVQLKVFRSGGPTDPLAKAQEILKNNKHSVTTSVPELNKLGLTKEQMQQVLLGAYSASGRAAFPQPFNGGIVLLSRRPGKDQAVVIIDGSGQARMGTADIAVDMNDMKNPIKGTNIK